MTHVPKLLNAFCRLLRYPDAGTSQAAELLYVVLQAELPEAAADAARFGEFAEKQDVWELEEAFTRTFDINPACALEVGWHLFGEEYARGLFLVRMREELRKHGLRESAELPDHIAHVLSVLAAMPGDEAARFATACVLPAVAKMHEALRERETPYRHVMASLVATLKHAWGDLPSSRGRESPAFRGDPLRAFPVADVGCREARSEESPELVPLTIKSAGPPRSKTTNQANEP